MKSELTILMLEDDVNDAELVQHELRRGGLQFRANCVQTRTAFLEALERDAPDVILSDHGLPAFGGFEAMVIAKKKYPDIPFIFVTGLEGEENEARTRECGATDYVLKTELSRLAPAVTRAIHEAGERIIHREEQLVFAKTEPSLDAAAPRLADYVICMLDAAGHVTSYSSGAGYQAGDILGRHFSLFYPFESIALGQPILALVWSVTLGRFEEETLLVRKDRFPFWAHVVLIPLWDTHDQLRGFAFIACEVSPKKPDEPD